MGRIWKGGRDFEWASGSRSQQWLDGNDDERIWCRCRWPHILWDICQSPYEHIRNETRSRTRNRVLMLPAKHEWGKLFNACGNKWYSSQYETRFTDASRLRVVLKGLRLRFQQGLLPVDWDQVRRVGQPELEKMRILVFRGKYGSRWRMASP